MLFHLILRSKTTDKIWNLDSETKTQKPVVICVWSIWKFFQFQRVGIERIVDNIMSCHNAMRAEPRARKLKYFTPWVGIELTTTVSINLLNIIKSFNNVREHDTIFYNTIYIYKNSKSSIILWKVLSRCFLIFSIQNLLLLTLSGRNETCTVLCRKYKAA